MLESRIKWPWQAVPQVTRMSMCEEVLHVDRGRTLQVPICSGGTNGRWGTKKRREHKTLAVPIFLLSDVAWT
jgi:hypothetical protein